MTAVARPGGLRRLAPVIVLGAIVWLLAAGAALAADPSPSTAPVGPPFPDPVTDQAVYDEARILSPVTVANAERVIDAIEDQTGAEVVVYTQATGRDDLTTDGTIAAATTLMDQWGVGRADEDDGLVLLIELDSSGAHGQVALVPGPGFEDAYLTSDDLQAVIDDEMIPLLASGDPDGAVMVALAHVIQAAMPSGGATGPDPAPEDPAGAPAFQVPPGPPFPDPVDGRAVYDQAGVLSPQTVANAEATIDAIEERTGAEVVLYTQANDRYDLTEDETRQRAAALIDQWGIGRAGFDDGMVVFIDLDPSLEHGQVQLYAGPGFEAAFLSNEDRQRIFEDDMLPYLRSADFDGAVNVALERIDAAATPAHAEELQRARQANAAVGLVGAPLALIGLSAWAFVSWRRHGKDPVYLDDPSIHIPAPPPDLTAASGAMVMDGHTSRRALTTAMLDLASRGLLSFREDRGILGMSDKVGIETEPATGDEVEEAQRARNARRPIGDAEQVALRHLRKLGSDGKDGYIDADDLPKFGEHVDEFDRVLEAHVVEQGWFAEAPSKVSNRWSARGVIAIIAGVVATFFGFDIPMSGLVMVGVATIIGGAVILLFAGAMPAVTREGSMIRAMLHAYRRTLEKTMAQARSMQQVVDEAGLDWLETPDQAVVWGTALGLQDKIQDVLERSLQDVKRDPSRSSTTWFPAWYSTSSGHGFASSGGVAGSGASLFSGSGIPNIGGMMASLGTIGNSPASSGGGGGGGFSGGSSGGGGGGAGGGF